MSAIQNFAFHDHLVRKIEINGQPWFVGKDICECLDLKNYRSSLDLLDQDEKGVHSMDTLGGLQNAIIVSLPGVFRLIFRSRKQEAEEFKRWLAHEVLPEIMQTGGYRVETAPVAPLMTVEALGIERIKLDMVREARIQFGIGRARLLWDRLGLPHVPQIEGMPANDDNSTDDIRACLTYFLNFPVDDDMRNVAELLHAAKGREEDALATLERLGIRVVADGYWVAASKPEMKAVWAKSRWRDALWVSILKQIPGVSGSHDRISIGGYQCRPIWFPASALN